MPPFECPCCGFATLEKRAAYEICPVCHWEDDGQGDTDADVECGGPNPESLAAARRLFQQGGPLTTEPPSADARFPLLRLGGTPREIGLAHGSLCVLIELLGECAEVQALLEAFQTEGESAPLPH